MLIPFFELNNRKIKFELYCSGVEKNMKADMDFLYNRSLDLCLFVCFHGNKHGYTE